MTTRQKALADLEKELEWEGKYIGSIFNRDAGYEILSKENVDTIRAALQDAQPEEVTEAELTKKFDPAPVFSESFHWICGWIKDNYPNGLRITHDKGE